MRFPEGGERPTALVWLLAVVSLLLPVAGVATALFGLFMAARGNSAAWYWVAAGTALILADMVIDWLWAGSGASKSDEPDLNRRGAQLIGVVVVVDKAIEAGGRGSVRAGDTVWAAEGAAAAAGTRVRVTGAKGTVLTVELI
jgi:membrane protein implicated in regulation of membrane protease activity